MTNQDFFIPDELYITGGKSTMGEVETSGAKNAILGLMAAALLTDEEIVLNNVPNITDVIDMGHIMKDLGVNIRFNPEKKKLYLHAKKINKNTLSLTASKFRASYYLWGSLLARFRHTKEFDSLKVCLPGGCSFGGQRPTDFHEKLIKNVFNADIKEEKIKGEDYLVITLPKKEKEDENPIYSTLKVSHGATFHWLLSVAGTKNLKVMYNTSLEPEVSNLVSMLQGMGLSLDGNERTGLISHGNSGKLLKGGEFSVIPDRLEAATYALLALGTRGAIRIKGITYEHCTPWLSLLNKIDNSNIYYNEDKTEVVLDFHNVKGFDGLTMQMSPFPGMETDVQQIWAGVLGQAKTESVIIDIIWPGRSISLKEMQNFGLKSEFYQTDVDIGQGIFFPALVAKIKPSELRSGKAEGMDLRGTAGLIVLASSVKGKSTILEPGYSLRGYPNLVENLKNLGLDISQSKQGKLVESLPNYKI